MNEPTPTFIEKNLLFIREEKSGYFSIIPKYHPNGEIQLVNRTAKMIMDLCNGKNSINSIIDNIRRRYPNTDEKLIKKDTFDTLSKLNNYRLIKWNSINPFINNKDVKINDFAVKWIQEENYEFILDIFSKIGKSLDNPQKNNKIFYLSPIMSAKLYAENLLRHRFFSFTEDFFVLFKESKPITLLSVLNSRPISSSSQIGIILSLESNSINISVLIESVLNLLKNDTSNTPTKLRWNIKTEDKEINRFAKNNNFIIEAEFKHELGLDKHLNVFSYFFV